MTCPLYFENRTTVFISYNGLAVEEEPPSPDTVCIILTTLKTDMLTASLWIFLETFFCLESQEDTERD